MVFAWIVTMPIQSLGIITRDNVSVDVSAVAYFRVVDAVLEVLAAVSILRGHLPDLRVRVVNRTAWIDSTWSRTSSTGYRVSAARAATGPRTTVIPSDMAGNGSSGPSSPLSASSSAAWARQPLKPSRP
ncbi:hypothetical protein ABH926_008704 [Catenulispora sp. GP43]